MVNVLALVTVMPASAVSVKPPAVKATEPAVTPTMPLKEPMFKGPVLV